MEYEVPFDVNLRDVNGQTVLYLACCIGNLKIVELLLKYQVKAKKTVAKTATLRKKKFGSKDDHGLPCSIATRSSLQNTQQSSIQALISKLRWSTQEEVLGPDEEWINPLDLGKIYKMDLDLQELGLILTLFWFWFGPFLKLLDLFWTYF